MTVSYKEKTGAHHNTVDVLCGESKQQYHMCEVTDLVIQLVINVPCARRTLTLKEILLTKMLTTFTAAHTTAVWT